MFGDAPGESFRIGRELQQIDNRLSPTDVAILACFLSDGQAEDFFTTDQKLIVNVPLHEAIRDRWEGKSINGF